MLKTEQAGELKCHKPAGNSRRLQRWVVSCPSVLHLFWKRTSEDNFTSQMLFLSPNQHCQNAEGKKKQRSQLVKMSCWPRPFVLHHLFSRQNGHSSLCAGFPLPDHGKFIHIPEYNQKTLITGAWSVEWQLTSTSCASAWYVHVWWNGVVRSMFRSSMTSRGLWKLNRKNKSFYAMPAACTVNL